jgi:hypothetical protein
MGSTLTYTKLRSKRITFLALSLRLERLEREI